MLLTKRTKTLGILAGCFLYAFGVNVFIIPLNLFSGGAVGLAQLLAIPAQKLLPAFSHNLIGIIYCLINLPLLWLAWRHMGKSFFFRTLLGAGAISLFMSLIPIAKTPLVSEEIVSILLGGIVSGIGIGLVLMLGGCGGGFDIIAIVLAKKYKSLTVGKVSYTLNALIYCVLLLMFDLQTFIYSMLYMVFFTVSIDRSHFQSINMRLMIFTKRDAIDEKIMRLTGRGVTEWNGLGAYSKEQTHVLITCINKYERTRFLEIIHSIDPEAFIICDEGVQIFGNFEKRLES